jgi:hypothetical protein
LQTPKNTEKNALFGKVVAPGAAVENETPKIPPNAGNTAPSTAQKPTGTVAGADRLVLIADILQALPPADRAAMVAELPTADKVAILGVLLSSP